MITPTSRRSPIIPIIMKAMCLCFGFWFSPISIPVLLFICTSTVYTCSLLAHWLLCLCILQWFIVSIESFHYYCFSLLVFWILFIYSRYILVLTLSCFSHFHYGNPCSTLPACILTSAMALIIIHGLPLIQCPPLVSCLIHLHAT